MAMGRHRDEVALLALARGGDFLRGVAPGENRLHLEAFSLQIVGNRLDVLAVVLHLLRLAQLQLPDVARRPAISDMDEDERRATAGAGKLSNVVEYHRVVLGVLERDQNALVHQLIPPLKNCSSSQVLRPAITDATR